MKGRASLCCVAFLTVALPPVLAAGHDGERPPAGASAELFGRGVISTGGNEFSTAFSPDGEIVYFSVSAPAVEHHPFVVLESHLSSDGWGEPRVSSFSGGPWSDADPFVTIDGSRLFFMSNRPVEGDVPRKDFDLWMVHRTGEGWGEPVHLGPGVNTDAQEIFVSVARDGTLYFSSLRDDGLGGMDIYRSRRDEGRYAKAENVGGLNTESNETNPLILPDGDVLIFSSDQDGGLGASDLYVSHSRDGSWSVPANLGPDVNSAADDFAPALSPDGTVLFFTSRRHTFAPILPGDRLTYERLRERISRAGNGNGDIYSVSISRLPIP